MNKAAREVRNDLSRRHADNHHQPWSDEEIETLMTWSDLHSEEYLALIAEELGRTIEACRQRYYEITWGHTDTRQRYAEAPRENVRWVDDDEWPDWYVRG